MPRLLLALLIAVPLAASAPDTQTKNTRDKKTATKAAGKRPTAATSLTGCLDQQGETYVLRELSTAGTVSTLKGKAFSNDNFARYVGHKVTVHGVRESSEQSSVIHVTKVDDAGPGCSK